jgi:hypothetical protein
MDASTGMYAPQVTGLIAGEDLDAVAPCYIRSADGLVMMSNGTAVNEAAEFVGFTPRAARSGQAVTLFGLGARFRYGTGLTPGDVFFLGATAGRLDTAATTGGTYKLARVLTATDIVVIAPQF